MDISHSYINPMVQHLEDSQLGLNGIPRERFSSSLTISKTDPENILKFLLDIDSPFFTFIRTEFSPKEAFSLMEGFISACVGNKQEDFLSFLSPDFTFALHGGEKLILEGGVAEFPECFENKLFPILNKSRSSNWRETYFIDHGVPTISFLGGEFLFSLGKCADEIFKITSLTIKTK